MELFITFIILNIANVIIQTVKTIVTVKCKKGIAAIVNAVAFGLYTIVTVYMMCELNLYLKAGIVALCNLIGVYVVKSFEEKARKDKLWKVEATAKLEQKNHLVFNLIEWGIPHNCIDIGEHVIFNIYCNTQKESRFIRNLLQMQDIKYFVSETKIL